MLVGGGALYQDLVNAFRQEFDGILNIIVPENPMMMASKGYLIHSKRKSEKFGGNPVGIDIGNADTCITMFDLQGQENEILSE